MGECEKIFGVVVDGDFTSGFRFTLEKLKKFLEEERYVSTRHLDEVIKNVDSLHIMHIMSLHNGRISIKRFA